MRRIAVRQVTLAAGLLCFVASQTRPYQAQEPRTFTFTSTFGADGCPKSSTPDTPNCENREPDCLAVHAIDRVKFRPADPAKAPKYKLEFDAASKLTTKADPPANDGKHWELVISSDTPKKVKHKFSVVSEKCATKLDPTIIILP